jgi:hypothetical protein
MIIKFHIKAISVSVPGPPGSAKARRISQSMFASGQ